MRCVRRGKSPGVDYAVGVPAGTALLDPVDDLR